MDDKMKHKADELKGTAKERIGGATGDEQKQAEGKVEKAEADLKQAVDKVKDAFK
jgi:uncharacterized protein YjbJ (UPF0337 family)